MAKTSKKVVEVTFDSFLVLFRYFLGEIAVNELKALSKELNSTEYEDLDEGGNTYFFKYISNICEMRNSSISKDLLKEYDENILRHTKHIGQKRGGIKWKYFQYISLLFTEMYLDRYFSDKDAFCSSLNEWLEKIRTESLGSIDFADYTPDKMNKLAYMCATGSGKTLIMHVNILQFQYYLRRAQRINSKLQINKIIVLSPNEGMSLQHLQELELSSIPAALFQKDSLFTARRDQVVVIDMNKLKEEGKQKTVSVDSFEKDNLVLVDEAHRGLTSGEVWYEYRTRLCEEGFAFEYSATFKQSLNSNATSAGDKALMEEYGKSIIMDYSYKYFYEDGYGKDYRIYNLKEGIDAEHKDIYLTGCLLSFFQQLKYYQDKHVDILPFNLEKPLLVFVGNRVTASTSKSELSDVQEVLDFIDRFVRRKSASITRIKAVITESTGLLDDSGRDLFQNDLEPLRSLYGVMPDASVLFNDIIKTVFNTDIVADEPRLHVVNIKQIPGEIGLKIGEYGDYFGVINIGDTAALIKACESKGIVSKSEEFVNDSFFRNINNRDSKIKILIGSRKFTEGWNSWRVSTMGLINFAKGEGSQAIQLFGRGVRLRGYNGALKRSSKADVSVMIPKHISCVETLTIFGVKAEYMEAFKKHIDEEGAPTNDEIYNYKLPVISRFNEVKGKKLCVIKVKDGVNFKKQARRLILDVPDASFRTYLIKSPTQIDCYSKIQSITSYGSGLQLKIAATKEEHVIPDKVVDILDYTRIYHELQQYKNEKCYYNICLVKKNLPCILKEKGWYKLLIPQSHMVVDSYKKLDSITDFAIIALKSYIDKFYKFERERWENQYLELAELTSADNNFIDEYTVTYTRDKSLSDQTGIEIGKFINDASLILNKHNGLDSYKKVGVRDSLVLFDFRSHLYAPLICLANNNLKIQISPVSLNKAEMTFVDKLKAYVETHQDILEDKTLYLLRNKSKVGMGFFDAGNFYPDYILWIDTVDKQYVSFVDPKGLMHIMPGNPKIEFYKTIKEYEKELLAKSLLAKPVVLNSFIMSSTEAAKLREWWQMDISERESKNVYTLDDCDCVDKMMAKILVS